MLMKQNFAALCLSVLLLALLASCGGQQAVSQPARPVFPATPTGPRTAVVTLLPVETVRAQQTAAYPVPSTQVAQVPATAYPAAPTATQPPAVTQGYPAPGHATLTPQAAPTEAPPQLHVANNAQPWKDCALAPGWIACDAAAAPVAAHLALQAPSGPYILALDLASGAGWQFSSSALRMDWSPQGSRLLLGVGEQQYLVLDAAGQRVEQFSSPVEPRWQPDGSLSHKGEIQSAQGARAWLERTSDLRWALHTQPAAAAEEKTYALEPQPTDRLYHLVGWAPGASLVLGQFYYANNAAMMEGGQLFLFDTQSGQRRDLDANAPLGYRASFAWSPGDPRDTLAFIETGGMMNGMATLALLNRTTGQLRYPLPQGLRVTALDWQPDGAQLTFAAEPLGEIQPGGAAQTFTRSALYQLNPASGEVKALTQPPQGAVDGLPRWLPDGSTLLYARHYTDQAVLEVHAYSPQNGQDRVLIAGLPAPCGSQALGCDWQSWLSIATR